ncbi:hypothetical protein CKO45_00170 [Paracraurococcus ruber]|uniref:Transposase n=1 Tax=Paracraurococcus ruber TaxID=77675 RepID=A0ABS1CQJ0_9PROT|nr:hypothetical protein [Paracraurococcus ruber]
MSAGFSGRLDLRQGAYHGQKRCTVGQIAFGLRQAKSGTAVAEICRTPGATEPTGYRWKKQFACVGMVQIGRLK